MGFTKGKKRMDVKSRIGRTKYGLINNIVDIPYFAGRKDTRMLQFVDLLAYGVFQHYEHSRSAYFDLIKTKFDRKFRGGPQWVSNT